MTLTTATLFPTTSMRRFGHFVVISVAAFASGSTAQAFDPTLEDGSKARRYEKPYDGIQAGIDAQLLADEKRRANLAGQAATTDFLGSGAYRVFPPLPPPWATIPSWHGWYFYEANPTQGFNLPERRIIGQEEVQTGENRWESRPIYWPPLPSTVRDEAAPRPPIFPAPATDEPDRIPTRPRLGGRREF